MVANGFRSARKMSSATCAVVLAQLPTSAEVTEIAKQPVIVRTYAERGRMTVVAMNMSPWRCDANVTIDVPQATTLERLTQSSDDATSSQAISTSGRSGNLGQGPLGPYEISVVRIPIAGAKVVDVQITCVQQPTPNLPPSLPI